MVVWLSRLQACNLVSFFFFFSSRRRHTRFDCDWSSDVCSSDLVSMQHSTELREPFLDHRLVELALRQRAERKLQGGIRKWLLRDLTRRLLPNEVDRKSVV